MRESPSSFLVSGIGHMRAALEERGVSGVSLFGSRARGDHRPDSDADLLLDIDPAARLSLLDVVDIESMLSEKFGIAISAILRRSLDDSYLHSIASDEIRIF